MNVFVVGSKGQLGLTLAETVPGAVGVAGAARADRDKNEFRGGAARLAAERPAVVVNGPAKNPVDKGEDEPHL